MRDPRCHDTSAELWRRRKGNQPLQIYFKSQAEPDAFAVTIIRVRKLNLIQVKELDLF